MHYYMLIAKGPRQYVGGIGLIPDSKVYRTRETAERAMSEFKSWVCDGEVFIFDALDPKHVEIRIKSLEFVDE